MRFAIAAYIIPFAFALDDSLLLMGDLTRLPLAFGIALVGVVLLSNSVASLSSSRLGAARRLFFFVAAILLVLPILHLTPVGVAMGLAGGAMHQFDSGPKYFARSGKGTVRRGLGYDNKD